jgi:hypothetical protein
MSTTVTQASDGDDELPPDSLVPDEIEDYREYMPRVKSWASNIDTTVKAWYFIRETCKWSAYFIGGLWIFAEAAPRIIARLDHWLNAPIPGLN